MHKLPTVLALIFAQVLGFTQLGWAKPSDLPFDASRAPYKMLFLTSSSKDFNPEQDVLSPTPGELVMEEVRTTLLRVALKSALPFVGQLSSVNGLNLNEQLMVMATQLRSELSDGLKVAIGSNTVFPITRSFMLIPNIERRDNLFYDSDKISMSSTDIVNALSLSPGHQDFEPKLTEAIRHARDQFLLNIPSSKLVAARSDITVVSQQKSLIKLQVLVLLNPGRRPFAEQNDQVKFDWLVIPENDKAPAMALLTFNIEASKNAPNPTLDLQLGTFDKFSNGQFLMSPKDQEKSVPTLEGHMKNGLLKMVGVNVGFSKMRFDLTQLTLTEVNTITQPGLKIGKGSFVLGGFRVSSVDKQFQAEINKKIDAEVSKAIADAKEEVASKVVSKDIMARVLTTILEQ